MKLKIIEIKNNKKRVFEIERNFYQARNYLIRLYYSNKTIYCCEIYNYYLSYDDEEELEFWQFRKIEKLIKMGFKFEKGK